MPDFVFTDPVDGLGHRADFDVIDNLLRTRGEDYWNNPNGSGFAGLSYYPEGNGNEPGMVASLDFTKLDNLGVHLSYWYDAGDYGFPDNREPESYKSFAGGPLAARTRIGWAGEDRLIFDALFVSVDDAVEAVGEFLSTGGRSPKVGWIQSRDVVKAEKSLRS